MWDCGLDARSQIWDLILETNRALSGHMVIQRLQGVTFKISILLSIFFFYNRTCQINPLSRSIKIRAFRDSYQCGSIKKLADHFKSIKIYWQWKCLSVDLPPAFPSCTVALADSPFGMMDTDTHTHTFQAHISIRSVVRVVTNTQTHTQTGPILLPRPLTWEVMIFTEPPFESIPEILSIFIGIDQHITHRGSSRHILL